VDERGCQPDQAGIGIDRGRMDRCDLVLAQALADKI
jgi:hypothetical protein